MMTFKLSDTSWTPLVIVSTISKFILMATFWWLYFELVEKHLLGKNLSTGQNIVYGHLFIYIGFTIVPEISIVDFSMLSLFCF
jgi:low temperature requirement protein LtrA